MFASLRDAYLDVLYPGLNVRQVVMLHSRGPQLPRMVECIATSSRLKGTFASQSRRANIATGKEFPSMRFRFNCRMLCYDDKSQYCRIWGEYVGWLCVTRNILDAHKHSHSKPNTSAKPQTHSRMATTVVRSSRTTK